MTSLPSELSSYAIPHLNTAQLTDESSSASLATGNVLFPKISSYLATQIDPKKLNSIRVSVSKPGQTAEKTNMEFYKAVAKLVAEEFGTTPTGKEFLQNIHADQYGFAVFSRENLNQYFSSLTSQQFNELFIKAAQDGFWYIPLAMVNHEKFKELRLDSLQTVALEALKNEGPKELVAKITGAENLSEVRLLTTNHLNEIFIKSAATNNLQAVTNMLRSTASLSNEDLTEALVITANNGTKDITIAILQDERFTVTPESRGNILLAAAKGGNTDLFHTITEHPKFAEISSADYVKALRGAAEKKNSLFYEILQKKLQFAIPDYAIRDLVKATATGGDLEIFSAALQAITPERISPEVIGDAFAVAASHDSIKIVNHIMQSPLFNQLPPESLGLALYGAVLHRHLSSFSAIASNTRFAEISENHLGTALEEGAKLGESFTSPITNSSKFARISAESFNRAFFNAVTSNQPVVAVALMNTARFAELTYENLRLALSAAAGHGAMEVVWRIVNSSRFESFSASEKDIIYSEAIVAAIASGKTEAITQLMTDRHYKDLTPNALGAVLIAASEFGRFHILQVLSQDDRFEKIPDSAFGIALREAAKNGHLTLVATLLNYPITVKDLQDALLAAARSRQFNNMLVIYGHPQADKIPPSFFGYMLNDLVNLEGSEAMSILLSRPSVVKKIKPADFEKALYEAVRQKKTDIVTLILNSQDASFTKDGLIKDLELACRRNDMKLISLLINHPKYADLTADDLGIIIEKMAHHAISTQGSAHSIAMLLSHKNSATIEPRFLSAALGAGVARGNREVLTSVMAHPNSNKIDARDISKAIIDMLSKSSLDYPTHQLYTPFVLQLIQSALVNLPPKETNDVVSYASNCMNRSVISVLVNSPKLTEYSTEAVADLLKYEASFGDVTETSLLLALPQVANIPEATVKDLVIRSSKNPEVAQLIQKTPAFAAKLILEL